MGKIKKLSKIDVERAASLAQLPLTDKEKVGLTQQLSKIIGYFQEIQEVDTGGVEPTFNVSGEDTVTRSDKAETVFGQHEALENAPRQKNGFFVVDKVLQK